MGEALELVGKELFGRAARLRLTIWIQDLDGEAFYQGEAATAVGVSSSNVKTDLDRLTKVGMLAEMPPARGNDRRYYVPMTDHPLWGAIRLISDYCDSQEAANGADP